MIQPLPAKLGYTFEIGDEGKETLQQVRLIETDALINEPACYVVGGKEGVVHTS